MPEYQGHRTGLSLRRELFASLNRGFLLPHPGALSRRMPVGTPPRAHIGSPYPRGRRLTLHQLSCPARPDDREPARGRNHRLWPCGRGAPPARDREEPGCNRRRDRRHRCLRPGAPRTDDSRSPRSTREADALLADPDVALVVICTPPARSPGGRPRRGRGRQARLRREAARPRRRGGRADGRAAEAHRERRHRGWAQPAVSSPRRGRRGQSLPRERSGGSRRSARRGRRATSAGGRCRSGAASASNGGGVLYEIGTHHVDLWRHLLGEEIDDVGALCRTGETEDETAVLTGRASGGAIVAAVLSDQAPDANEVDIIGSDGRLRFSLYRGDSLEVTSREPDYRAASTCPRARRTGPRRSRPPSAPHARAETSSTPTRAQLERVVAAIRGDGRPAATWADGLQAAAHRRRSGRRRRRPAADRRSNADMSSRRPRAHRGARRTCRRGGARDDPLHLRAQTMRERHRGDRRDTLGRAARRAPGDDGRDALLPGDRGAVGDSRVARQTLPALARPLRRSSPSQRITRTSTRSGARPSSRHTKATGRPSDPRSGTQTRPR